MAKPADGSAAFHRILLKLSGEALMGDKEFGLELPVIEKIAGETGEEAHEAPRTTPVRRLDEVRAARQLIATYDARVAGAG